MRSVSPSHAVGWFPSTSGTYKNAKVPGTTSIRIVLIEYRRNQFRNEATPNPTVSTPNKAPTPARVTCMVSVNVISAPRMCIGKKFHNTKPFTALMIIINAKTHRARFRPADIQMPSVNATKSTEYNVKSRTTRWLVGAPIANSSLTA